MVCGIQNKTQTIADLQQQVDAFRKSLEHKNVELESTADFQTQLSEKEQRLTDLNEQVRLASVRHLSDREQQLNYVSEQVRLTSVGHTCSTGSSS